MWSAMTAINCTNMIGNSCQANYRPNYKRCSSARAQGLDELDLIFRVWNLLLQINRMLTSLGFCNLYMNILTMRSPRTNRHMISTLNPVNMSFKKSLIKQSSTMTVTKKFSKQIKPRGIRIFLNLGNGKRNLQIEISALKSIQ